MNGFEEIQRALVASRQGDLRHEADTVRLAADATFAVTAERTRHATSEERTAVAARPTPTAPVKARASAPPAGCVDAVADCREGSLAA